MCNIAHVHESPELRHTHASGMYHMYVYEQSHTVQKYGYLG